MRIITRWELFFLINYNKIDTKIQTLNFFWNEMIMTILAKNYDKAVMTGKIKLNEPKNEEFGDAILMTMFV